MIKNDDSSIDDLNNLFYSDPNSYDVIQALSQVIKSTIVNTIA
jgi:hypothetical protein